MKKKETPGFYFDNFLGWFYWQWCELTDWRQWSRWLVARLDKRSEWIKWESSQWGVTSRGETVHIIRPGKTWKAPSQLARWIIALLTPFLLSGCDALEAKRLNAEAAASRAKAAEISAAYDGRARIIEAKTADKIAEQDIFEENLEAKEAAETHAFLLRQLELDRKAARRANDLALLAIVGAPLALTGAVAGVVVFLAWRKRREARRVTIYRRICWLQRRGLLRTGFDRSDVDAILSGVVPLEWYVIAPDEVASLPGGDRC